MPFRSVTWIQLSGLPVSLSTCSHSPTAVRSAARNGSMSDAPPSVTARQMPRLNPRDDDVMRASGLLLRCGLGAWRGTLARGRRRLHRVVGEPVPVLAAAQDGDAEIAAHFERLAVVAELHLGVVDRAVARIHDRPVLVGGPVALHALDQRESEHRAPLLRAFAFLANPVLVLAGLEEDLDDVAFIDAVVLRDLEPALGLSGFLVDLLPQPHGRGHVGCTRRQDRGGVDGRQNTGRYNTRQHGTKAEHFLQ